MKDTSSDELFKKGFPLEASKVFLQEGRYEEACVALELAGENRQAIELALHLDFPMLAMKIADRHGCVELFSLAASRLLLQENFSLSEAVKFLDALRRPAKAAELLASMGSPKEAALYYEKSGLKAHAARQWMLVGDWRRASSLAESHLSLNPLDFEARRDLILLYLEGSREIDAIAQAQEHLAHEPQNTECRRLLNIALERLGLAKASSPSFLSGNLKKQGELGILERYNLLALVGQGATGRVYLAEDRWTAEKVAIKRLNPNLFFKAGAHRRFWLESRILLHLNHPGVVKILHVHEHLFFVVMEYLEGGSLEKRLKSGSLSLSEIRVWALDILETLEKVHFAGILHRDIKPSNLIFTNTARLKLVDFGSAHILDSSWTSSNGRVVGAYGYMAPEQLLGQPLSPATDLYALGVVLYEAICGRRPFPGKDLIREQIEANAPWPSFSGRRLAPTLARAVLKFLNKAPEDRYSTAKEALHALSAVSWECEPLADETCVLIEDLPARDVYAPVSAIQWPNPRYLTLETKQDFFGSYQKLHDLWLERDVWMREFVEKECWEACKSELLERGAFFLKLNYESGQMQWLGGA